MTRITILDPPGASNSIADAPSAFEERSSKRLRRPTVRAQESASQNTKFSSLPPPKRRKKGPLQTLPSPINSQTGAYSLQQPEADTIEIWRPENKELPSQAEEQDNWEARYAVCKNKQQQRALLEELFPGEAYIDSDRLAIPP